MTARVITALYHRPLTPVRRRHFARIGTAMPTSLNQLIAEGHPGDVVSLVHRSTETHLVDIKIHANKRITITWSL